MLVRSVLAATAAVTMLGCSPQPATKAAAINDRVYAMTPDTLKVKAGLVSGEVTEMKVTESIEEGSGRVATAARLSGKLVLKNVSANQTLRLVGGKIVYIDQRGQAIPLEANRTEPLIKMASSYGSADRLDPGQEWAQTVEVDFPAAALKAKTLKEIRVELSYIPSPYREETLTFPVSLGAR